MARFSLRRSSRPDDHIVFCNGVEVGRCYLRAMNYGPAQWLWTIYIGEGVILGDEAPVAGVADTLDKAVAEFRNSFDRMINAGAVKVPRG